MVFNHIHYVPCLRWKVGEYQAILRLSETARSMITPLIEIPEYGFDFDKRKKPKSMEDHLNDVPKRIHDKWGKAPCFIDMKHISCSKNMANGKNPVAFIYDKLLEAECSFILVTGLERDKQYQAELKKILVKNRTSGLCLRVTIDNFINTDIENALSSLLKELEVELNDTHLVIDLGTPNFIPLDGFTKAIFGAVSRLSSLNNWRTYSVLGTSFPVFIKKGITILPRYEWQLYKMLIAEFTKKKLRLPAFGDYTIAHSGDIPDLDWRIIKPAATIRYTIDDGWYISKGKSLRDGPITQCHEMCLELVKSRHFIGAKLSYGDQFIQKCASDKTMKVRNHSLWRQVGTSHHLEKVAQDIANFYDSLKNS